ncbi:hypothetical protein YpMG051020_2931 [Yersinia pestis biovar Orientalis str. MG05-1020]|nr:hypothetical protein YpMG051020_2931 [Yersinia pestis biovar Orientalis str. MG05-1020]EDR59656.1 hypothetical protein YpUG050454_4113 [Yersinia pestis biovar Antiqua str. UG05-0454]
MLNPLSIVVIVAPFAIGYPLWRAESVGWIYYPLWRVDIR